ncbi:MAG: hypothetical protein JWP09_294 [Candidatus Taylorbacteria bacterium]|nr:hypothetical protein [Candidatus Taylorbacteria bacterium]
MKKEIIITSLLTALLAFFTIGGDRLLSHFMLMWVCIAFTFIFLFGVIFFLKEKPQDERELQHYMDADRKAYMFGSICLAVVIVHQGIWGVIEPLFPVVLLAMVLSRAIFLGSNRSHH